MCEGMRVFGLPSRVQCSTGPPLTRLLEPVWRSAFPEAATVSGFGIFATDSWLNAVFPGYRYTIASHGRGFRFV